MTNESEKNQDKAGKKGFFARLLAWIAKGAERAEKSGNAPCRS